MICATRAGHMRRVIAVLAVFLATLMAGCAIRGPLSSAPAATPTPYKPANLLTPRPTAVATPAPVGAEPAAPTAGRTPGPTVVSAVTSTSLPTPALRGTPATASEPLQGFLLDDRLTSPIIGESFPYRIYLPPDYLHAPQKHYPVLYMLHGAGGNYTEWTDSYLPEQADRMIVAGDLPPLIIVMPDDSGQTYWANWSEDGPRWGDYLTEDVVQTIDQRYRTLPTAASRGIGGLSMGGLGALNLAFQHPDVFGVVGAHSPSVRLEPDPALWFLAGQNFWDNNPIWLAQHRPGLDGLKIWLDAGTDDVWLPNVEAVHAALISAGLHTDWHIYPGPHEAEYWIEHVPDYLRFYGAALRT
jgi:enterochelin esterase-like enzyme